MAEREGKEKVGMGSFTEKELAETGERLGAKRKSPKSDEEYLEQLKKRRETAKAEAEIAESQERTRKAIKAQEKEDRLEEERLKIERGKLKVAITQQRREGIERLKKAPYEEAQQKAEMERIRRESEKAKEREPLEKLLRAEEARTTQIDILQARAKAPLEVALASKAEAQAKKDADKYAREAKKIEAQTKFAQTHPWMQTAGEKTLKWGEKGYATARDVLREAKEKQTPTQYARASSRQMKLLQRIQKMQMGGRERVSRAGARQVEAGTSLYRATLPSQVQQQQYVGQQMMQPQSEFEKLIGGKKDMNVGLFGEQQPTGQPAPSKLSPENLVGMGQKKYDVLGTGNKKYDLLGSSDKNIGLFGEASKKKKQNYY